MPVPLLGIVVLFVVVSATVGCLIVYLDARRRDEEHRILWTGATGFGFLFGVLPGLVLISVYFITSRKL